MLKTSNEMRSSWLNQRVSGSLRSHRMQYFHLVVPLTFSCCRTSRAEAGRHFLSSSNRKAKGAVHRKRFVISNEFSYLLVVNSIRYLAGHVYTTMNLPSYLSPKRNRPHVHTATCTCMCFYWLDYRPNEQHRTHCESI